MSPVVTINNSAFCSQMYYRFHVILRVKGDFLEHLYRVMVMDSVFSEVRTECLTVKYLRLQRVNILFIYLQLRKTPL